MIPLKEILKSTGKMFLNPVKVMCQSYATKKIHPVAVTIKSKRQLREEEYEENYAMQSEIKKEMKDEYERSGHLPVDPDLDKIGQAYDIYEEDYARIDLRIKRHKMYRKHYRPLIEKEVGLLTYEEKEKIRYLHDQNPEEWTLETLAEAFPVSLEGVEKLLKSKFKARSLQDILSHDSNLVSRIERIKSGEIPLTPDLDQRMEKREKIPFIVGSIGPGSAKLLTKSQNPKVIGEFASLVAPMLKHPSNPDSTQVDFPIGLSPSIISKLKDPEDGDTYMLKEGKEAEEELKNMNISLNKPMTLEKFKSDLNKINTKSSSAFVPSTNLNKAPDFQHEEIKYLKNFKENKVKPSSFVDAGISEESTRKYEYEEYLNFHTIAKYKPSLKKKLETVESNNVRMSNKHERESQINNRVYQTKNPMEEAEEGAARINIPSKFRKPGSVFKKGNNYYDEEGSFLYRVV